MDYETPDMVVREVENVTIARIRYANLTDIFQIQRMTAELERLMDTGVRKLIIDFKYVRHAGSASLGMLIQLQKKMKGLGGSMILSHAENIDELLSVSRTKPMFKLATDPKSAFKLF